MNPKHLDDRAEVAINKDTGGSYGLVQKWIHDMDLLRSTPDDVKEKWIGRTIEHSFELRDKSITSHILQKVVNRQNFVLFVNLNHMVLYLVKLVYYSLHMQLI
uniref:Dyp-type peroxidase C-terminal domain-containing protein n=1 Tax=Schistosoma mansoni TaxID=6183 RepID=A0A5K4FGE5_SCHMA